MWAVHFSTCCCDIKSSSASLLHVDFLSSGTLSGLTHWPTCQRTHRWGSHTAPGTSRTLAQRRETRLTSETPPKLPKPKRPSQPVLDTTLTLNSLRRSWFVSRRWRGLVPGQEQLSVVNVHYVSLRLRPETVTTAPRDLLFPTELLQEDAWRVPRHWPWHPPPPTIHTHTSLLTLLTHRPSSETEIWALEIDPLLPHPSSPSNQRSERVDLLLWG